MFNFRSPPKKQPVDAASVSISMQNKDSGAAVFSWYFLIMQKHTYIVASIALMMGSVFGFALAKRSNESVGAVARDRELSISIQEAPKASPVIDSAAEVSNLSDGLGSMVEQLGSLDPVLYREVQASFQDTILLEMVERMSAEHPLEVAAVLKLLPRERGDEFALVHLTQWSERDPQSALNWWRSQAGAYADEAYSDGLREVLSAYAKVNPQHAHEILDTVSNPQIKERLVQDIARAWSAKDLPGAMDWLASLRVDSVSDETYARCYSTLLSSFIDQDPKAAASLVPDLESETLRKRLLPQLVARLNEADPVAARGLFDRIESNELKREAMLSISENTSGQILAELISEHVEVLQGAPEFQSALFDQVAKTDWEGLANHVGLIPNAGKAAATEALADRWLKEGARARDVEAWHAELPNPYAAEGVAKALAVHYLQADVAAALSWAERIVTPETRQRLMRSIVEYADGTDLESMAGALVQARLPNSEIEALLVQVDRVLQEKVPVLILP